VKTPTFGLFDHIEGIPGDSPTKIFKDRLDFIRTADQAGFRSFHLAEHHGTDLSMAPNQIGSIYNARICVRGASGPGCT